ncbi:MAG TPA: hypothetical protein VFB12_14780, partial [Ktedonobacteraceae bacterium]|nr:hypothetical protein [Ktedonobacteraceae bacterium]
QQFSGSTLDVSTLRALRSLFSRTARDGRRRGVGMVIVAHRIAGILKEILQCDWMILHEPQRTDLKRYRQELAPDVPIERFMRLAKGKAVVISPVGTQEVTFHPARSRDQGKSPGLAELRRNESGTREKPELPPLPSPQTAAPLSPETPIVQEQEEAPTSDERGKREPLTPPQEQALALWKKGKEYQSVRKLARAMNIHPSTAGEIVDKLDRYGYIRKNRRMAE